MKLLSKAIAIISKIGKISCLVGIVLITISSIIMTVLLVNTEFDGNSLIWNGNEVLKVEQNDDGYQMSSCGFIIVNINEKDLNKVNSFIQMGSKGELLLDVNLVFAYLVIVLAITMVLLNHLEKLFSNINRGDTPFTLENVKCIKIMAYSMISITVISGIFEIVLVFLIHNRFDVGFEAFDLVEILFLFSIAYIFEYGYEIQLDSNGKMYGEIE